MEDTCGSHTFPYIEVKNKSSKGSGAQATTSKIGEKIKSSTVIKRVLIQEAAIALID